MVTVKQCLIDWMLPACFSASVAVSLELFYKSNHDKVILLKMQSHKNKTQ